MKILAIGDYERAPYHTFTGVDQAMKNLLEPQHELTCVEGYENLRFEVLKDYDIVINYIDAFGTMVVERDDVAGLVQYVAQGGRYLCLHGGVSIQKQVEAAHVLGAYFTGHPARLDLTFNTIKDHKIAEGVDEEFEIFEEPYQMDMRYDIPCDVFLTFVLDGRTCPGGWVNKYGKGTCIYLTPGHELAIFNEKNVTKLFCNCVEYLANI